MICEHDRLARQCRECEIIEDLAELESAHRMMHARNERLQKENDELAEALRGILRYPPFEETNNGERFYEQMRATAREVLRKYGLDGEEE